MNSRILLLVVAVLPMVSMAALPEQSAEDSLRSWNFDVRLDDKKIGVHRFELYDAVDRQVLRTEASFDVRFLFINAFRYRHENTEVWNDGCLESIDAKTDNNGDELTVRGDAGEDAFTVSSQRGEQQLAGCVKTFAYWNPSILESTRLLNSQTGEYEDVRVTLDGTDELRVGETLVESQRYTLTAAGGDIKLWYAVEDRRWLALEAPAKGGRTIRYEPVPPAESRQYQQTIAGGAR